MPDGRILLVLPNLPGMLVPGIAMAQFAGILKAAGYTVEFFDATHYAGDNLSTHNRVKYLQARPFTESAFGVEVKADLVGDFLATVERFQPTLILVSIVEDAFRQAQALLGSLGDRSIPVVVGGVFPTAAPDRCAPWSVALGEGERLVTEIAATVHAGQPLPQRWRDPTRVTWDDLPLPDYSIYHPSRLYRPMGGVVHKCLPLETMRGCPFTCGFCNSPMQQALMRGFTRRKPLTRVAQEARHLKAMHQPNLFYLVDDTFTARPLDEFEALCGLLRDVGVPFWCNTRPETLTKRHLDLLKWAGCYRMSLGIECGNEAYRKTMLHRPVSNAKLLHGFALVADSGLVFSVNNMLGFPDETPAMVFDTIALNRAIQGADTLTVSVFTPYHGTALRDYCVRQGYLAADALTTHTTAASMLTMPSMSQERIAGLLRTFPLYVKFPKADWPVIQQAEMDDQVYTALAAEYRGRYLSTPQPHSGGVHA